MTPGAFCLGPDATLAEAVALMRQLGVGVVPVCDHDRLAGLLTERDIAPSFLHESGSPIATRVRAVMSPGIFFVYEDQSTDDAAAIMQARQLDNLPVLNRDRRLIGMVARDALRWRDGAECAHGLPHDPHESTR